MRDFQNAYPNDYYSEFDRRYACWANNHNGWRKAKKKWRKIGKKRIRRETRNKIEQWENDVVKSKIRITTCKSGDWEILECDGYRVSSHQIMRYDWEKLLRHLGYEVEEVEVTDEEMEEKC